MTIETIYNLTADEGNILHNKNTDEYCHNIEGALDITEWEELPLIVDDGKQYDDNEEEETK